MYYCSVCGANSPDSHKTWCGEADVARQSLRQKDAESDALLAQRDAAVAEVERLRGALAALVETPVYVRGGGGAVVCWWCRADVNLAGHNDDCAWVSARTALGATPGDYDGETCEDCGSRYGKDGLIWRADDRLWNLMGWKSGGLLCPNCFAKRIGGTGVKVAFVAMERDEAEARFEAQRVGATPETPA